MNKANVKKNSTLYRSVSPSDLNTDEATVMEAITNELTKPVSVELYRNPRTPDSTVVYVKVIGFGGALYPLVNRNNELKGSGEVSINTVLDRISRGLKLFSV